jgi:hypothetical protein
MIDNSRIVSLKLETSYFCLARGYFDQQSSFSRIMYIAGRGSKGGETLITVFLVHLQSSGKPSYFDQVMN